MSDWDRGAEIRSLRTRKRKQKLVVRHRHNKQRLLIKGQNTQCDGIVLIRLAHDKEKWSRRRELCGVNVLESEVMGQRGKEGLNGRKYE